jgi:hypothetical protein
MSKTKNDTKKRKSDQITDSKPLDANKRVLLTKPSKTTALSISQQTGLSVFLLGVVVDICESNRATLSSTTLIDIVCYNNAVRVLNKEELDRVRPLFEKKKQKQATEKKNKTKTTADTEDAEEEDEPKNSSPNAKKNQNDEILRKFIIEERMHELEKTKIKIAGADNKYEKLDVEEQDKRMVKEFLGFAATDRGYAVYVYYVGPTNKGVDHCEMRDPKNWAIVHKNHLLHFHKRFRGNLGEYLKHSAQNQYSSDDPECPNPLYDPRYIALKWLNSKEGKQHRQLILENKHLFRQDKDFVVSHYEKEGNKPALYYFDESKEEEENTRQEKKSFDVNEDFKRQQKRGFFVEDEKRNVVTIEEFPPLCRIPIAKNIHFSLEDFLSVGKRLYAGKKMPEPPSYYNNDPLLLVKAAIISLNGDSFAKRTAALVHDEHNLILESDNIVPNLEYIMTNKRCRDFIKESTAEYVYALMATELASRDLIESSASLSKKQKRNPSFTLLDDKKSLNS